MTIDIGHVILGVVGFVISAMFGMIVHSQREKDRAIIDMVTKADKTLEAHAERLSEHGKDIAVLNTNTGSLIHITGEHGRKISDHGEAIAILREKTNE